MDLTESGDSINGNDLLSKTLSMNEHLKGLKGDGVELLVIGSKHSQIDSDKIQFDFDIVRAVKTEYPTIQLQSVPHGLPSNAILKMGVPKNGYMSAANEISKRYNPYLWTARNTGITHPLFHYLVTNVSPNQFDGWSNYDNCHYQWPSGDYCLYRGVSGTTIQIAQNAEISGSRFNTYLTRFYNKKLVDRINANLNTSTNIKYLYMSCYCNYNSGCSTCNYIYGGHISSIEYDYIRGKVVKLSNPLNIYTF